MYDSDRSDRDAAGAPLTRTLQLQCRALAAVPNEFRAVGTWLNYDCALLPHLDDPDDRTRVIEDMGRARASLDDVMRYFDLTAHVPGYDGQALAWFRGCLDRAPQKAEPFRVTASMLGDLQQVATDGGASLRQMHKTTSDYILTHLGPEITGLLDILNREVELHEHIHLSYAAAMHAKADAAVADITSVGQMVRMISLNASVEAARAGDAGRAFGVIASEVNAMSEAIQSSAGAVTETVRDLTDRL